VENRGDGMIEEAIKLVHCFVSGMSSYRLHPYDHKSVSRHAAEAVDIIKALRVENFLTITVSDDNTMLINGVRVSPDTPKAKKFFLKLRHKGVVTIVISKGVRVDELERFFGDLASSSDFFHSYAHIAVKRSYKPPRSNVPHRGKVIKDDILHVKRIYHDISVYGSVDMTTVDAVVGSIMASVRKEGHILDLLVPMKGHADDLYIHSSNVAILSIVQGEYLSFGNALLYDIGFAALLHDVGKTRLPATLLERQDSLSETEWTMMKKHPVHGAALLASLNKVPEIAMVVAYEHHMKYDGTGYPETRRRVRKQHIISQIVAVADFYCTLSADLPHRKPLSNASIMGLLLETAGREFNPIIVDNFVRAIGESSSGLSRSLSRQKI
jgi:HD-GYP domain-containing protein (c-di-GMP phosphodiesterase class II)